MKVKKSTKSTAVKTTATKKVTKKAPTQKAPVKKTTAKASVKRTRKKTAPKTRVDVHFDVGYGNTLYLRGNGPNLSWNQGVALKNSGPGQWTWETEVVAEGIEFKVIINDNETHFESGDNRRVSKGATLRYTPNFSNW